MTASCVVSGKSIVLVQIITVNFVLPMTATLYLPGTELLFVNRENIAVRLYSKVSIYFYIHFTISLNRYNLYLVPTEK